MPYPGDFWIIWEIYHICCGSILSLVSTLFSFVLGMVMYDDEFETKENRI